MNGRQLVFSNKRSHRIARHFTFWAVFTFYFYPQGIWYPDTIDQLFQGRIYWEALINFACFVPVCILATYISIYYLLPAFLEKKRYGRFALFFTVLFLICLIINYFFSWLYFFFIPHPEKETSVAGTIYLSYVNSMAAIILSTIGIGLKTAKKWSRQQRENLEMSKKKARTELQLHKARIHPEFLFRTLNNINARINRGLDDAPDMVLRLSDLLSYSLYCGKCKMVPLVQEIAALHDLVFLEKRMEDRFLNICVSCRDDHSGSYLPPMTIMCLLNDTIAYLNSHHEAARGAVVNVEIRPVNSGMLDISLNVHLEEEIPLTGWGTVIQNCILRLEGSKESLTYRIQEKRGACELVIDLQLKLNNTAIMNGKTKRGAYEPV